MSSASLRNHPQERPQKRQRKTELPVNDDTKHSCPHLHTVNRAALDFDLPWLCSVTLKSHSIYACLATGRFFHGRSASTPAYLHALHGPHRLFLGLSDARVYILPDGREVRDAAAAAGPLRDVVAALRPLFSPRDLPALDRDVVRVPLADGSARRLRGAVPLDNLHDKAFANVVLQLVMRPPPVRDALLLRPRPDAPPAGGGASQPPPPQQQQQPESRLDAALQDALAELCRKVWASHAFRPMVAPHTFMHLVDREFAKRSKKTGAQGTGARDGDPVMFCAWLLNAITGGGGKRDAARDGAAGPTEAVSKAVRQAFNGEMEVVTHAKDGGIDKKKPTKFWFLSLDLPAKALFKHESEREIVAQVRLEQLLRKFDGQTQHHVVETGESRSYNVTSLPPYLLLVLRRFTKSKFAMEKNPCVVHLPAKRLELSPVLKQTCNDYRLIGSVCHKGSLEKGEYKVSIYHEASESWHEISGGSVQPTLFQLVSLENSCVLLYERDDKGLARSSKET